MYDVVLSGGITGRKNYREEFAVAVVNVRSRWHGKKVWNPAELPDGREYKWYMRRCLLVILDECTEDAVFVRLKGWNRSLGAVAEWAVARCLGIKIVEQWW